MWIMNGQWNDVVSSKPVSKKTYLQSICLVLERINVNVPTFTH